MADPSPGPRDAQDDEILGVLTLKIKEFATAVNAFSKAIVTEGPLADPGGLEKSVLKMAIPFEPQIERFRKGVDDNFQFIVEGSLPRQSVNTILTDFSKLVGEFAGTVRNDPFMPSFEGLLTEFENNVRSLQGSVPLAAAAARTPTTESRATVAEHAPAEEVCERLLHEFEDLIEKFRPLIDSSSNLLAPLPDMISRITDLNERMTRTDTYLNLLSKHEGLVKSFEDLVQSFIDRSAACIRLANLRFELGEQNLKSIEDLLKSFTDLARSRMELRSTAIKQFEDLINSLLAIIKSQQDIVQTGFNRYEEMLKSIAALLTSFSQIATSVNTTRFKNFEDLVGSFETLLKSLADLAKDRRALAVNGFDGNVALNRR